MPIFKVRQDQPALPARSSSVPPMHLHSPVVDHTRSPGARLESVKEPATPTKASKFSPFAWSRLSQHLQQRVLSYALLPYGLDTPITIGMSEHRTHLNDTAVPIFLALGSWEAYNNAASIFYQRIHINLTLCPTSSMTFLTSPTTVRLRSLVVKIQLRFTIKEHMLLFDTGYTVSESRGKLIQMNIPTALRSMKTHGRLDEVELLIPTGFPAGPRNGLGAAIPGFYSPMARMQLASWASAARSDECLKSQEHYMPAEVVVAPAFLACRAFQSGLLPLLMDGVFDEKTKLGLLFEDDAEGDLAVNDNSIATIPMDVDALLQYWLGATVIQLFDVSHVESDWVDPFSLAVQFGEGTDELDLAENQALPAGGETNQSREAAYNLVSSPVKYTSSDQDSDDDTFSEDSSSSEATVQPSHKTPDALRGRSHPELADQGQPELSDDDASSELRNADQGTLRALHKEFGVTPPNHSQVRAEPRDDSPSPVPEAGSSSTSGDDSDAVFPSPAKHLEAARTDLITTLTAVVSSGDTMEALARADADRQLSSFAYGAAKRPCKHKGTVSACSAFRRRSDGSSGFPVENGLPPCTPSPKVPNDKASWPLIASGSTGVPGEGAADSHADTDTSSSDESEREIPWSDLSIIEEVFAARAADATIPDVDGGLMQTSCDLPDTVADPGKMDQPSYRQGVGVAESGDLDMDMDDETGHLVGGQASESVAVEPTADKGKAPAGMDHETNPTTPEHHLTAATAPTPLSANSKRSVKSKGTQTKRLPKEPPKDSRPAFAATNNPVSKKRKAPATTSAEPFRLSRAARRKRARAAKAQQLEVARRIEAEAAQGEKTLVN
ncbi:hypothetical protein VPNG_09845 [Cytospora leucostoma]|uniref:Uncharacterized protein n=1 Tax=Cytospora leucostoma TaxID=1230097 RepID=A0A423VIJ2_9PEZI|nr:hypothetical protein VPNG_09845 [Cytospora leucostoma]